MSKTITACVAIWLSAVAVAEAQTVPLWKKSGTSLAPVATTTSIKSILLPDVATASLPAAGTRGRIVADATTNEFKFDDGSAWRVMVHSGTSGVFQAADGDLDDLADGSLTGSKVGTGIDAGNITAGTVGNARLDADLSSIAGVTSAADKVPYYTGSGTADVMTVTAAARTVLDDTTVSAMVDTLGGTAATGTGAIVRATSPTLTTPLLGTPTSGTLTNCTGLPIATGVSGLGANVATALATPSSANIAAAATDETGSGSLVFATSPMLVTPALGTPSSGTLDNCWYPGKLIGYSCVETDQSTTSTTFTDLATAQSVTFTAPSAGNIWVHVDCESYNSAAGNANLIAVDLDGTDTTARLIYEPTANYTMSMSRDIALAVSSGSRTVKLQFRTTGGTANFVRRSLAVYWAP